MQNLELENGGIFELGSGYTIIGIFYGLSLKCFSNFYLR